jgi:hypothetical protein
MILMMKMTMGMTLMIRYLLLYSYFVLISLIVVTVSRNGNVMLGLCDLGFVLMCMCCKCS